MPLLQSTKDLLLNKSNISRDLYWDIAKKAQISEAKINKALKDYDSAARTELEKGVIGYLNTLPDLDKFILYLEIRSDFTNKFQPAYKNKALKYTKAELENRYDMGMLKFKQVADDVDCLWFVDNVNGLFDKYYFENHCIDDDDDDDADYSEDDKPEISKKEMAEIEDKLCKRFMEVVANHEEVPLKYQSYGSNPVAEMAKRAYETTNDIDKLRDDLNYLGYFPKKAATSLYARAQMKRGGVEDSVLKNLSITDDMWKDIPLTVELLQKVPPLKALGLLSRYEHNLTTEDVKRLLFPLINSSKAKEYGERITTLLREMEYDYNKMAKRLLEKPCAMNYKTGVNLHMSDFVEFLKTKSRDPSNELAEFMKFYFKNTSHGQKPYVRDAIDELLEGEDD